MASRLPAALLVGLMLLLINMATLAAETSNPPQFRYNGNDYLESDLPPAFRQVLFRLRAETYSNHSELLDAALLQIHLEQEAKARDMAPHALELELFPAPEPAEEDIEAFYEGNRHRIPYPLQDVRWRITEILKERVVEVQKRAYIAEVKKQGEFDLLIERPQSPRVDIVVRGRPVLGAPDAPVTVVEFSDFQCRNCRRVSTVLKAAVEHYGGRVKLVFMDYPINPSGISRTVSLGAVCAAEQNGFWPYHDLAFERQESLSHESPSELADALGLDAGRFQECLESDEAKILLGLSKAEGDRIGIAGAPTIFVNGRELILEDLEFDLAAAIEAALAGS